MSQHKLGNAGDGKFQDYSAEEVREDILAHPEKYPEITALELGVDWLHIDVRNCERIFTFSKT